MRIATLLFTYHRNYHTEKVLEALRNNTVLPQKLYVFQDGLKPDEDSGEWIKVNGMIHNIDWCDREIIVSDSNQGLADSIVSGINYAFRECDAVIVLEDDCVTHPIFMEYATGCLEKYQNDKMVFSVNGYSWNVDVQPNGKDAYFVGRTSSWGWATWKDRWKLYQQDYKLLGKIRKNAEKSREFDIWGQDLESHLLDNVYGKCNSWAVFWALKCIEQGGFCPTPYYSLISNIGFDGTGVHCGRTRIDINMREWDDRRTIVLPDKVEFPENYETIYSDCFHWIPKEIKLNCYYKILFQWNSLIQKGVDITAYFEQREIDNIAVWGRGDLCKLLLHELKEKVKVNFIVESQPASEQYENIPVISLREVPDETQSIVVIPVYDMMYIQRKIKKYSGVNLIGIDEILDNFVSQNRGGAQKC